MESLILRPRSVQVSNGPTGVFINNVGGQDANTAVDMLVGCVVGHIEKYFVDVLAEGMVESRAECLCKADTVVLMTIGEAWETSHAAFKRELCPAEGPEPCYVAGVAHHVAGHRLPITYRNLEVLVAPKVVQLF
jgi:hypothetical protein